MPAIMTLPCCTHTLPFTLSKPHLPEKEPSLDLAEEAGTGCMESWKTQFLYMEDAADPAEAKLWFWAAETRAVSSRPNGAFPLPVIPSPNGQSPRDIHRTWSILHPISGLGPGGPAEPGHNDHLRADASS